MALSQHAFKAMGCPCELRLFSDDVAVAIDGTKQCIEEALRLERKYSRYLHDSVTTTINRAAGQSAVVVDTETAALLEYSNACFDQSNGLFDITSGGLRRIWHQSMTGLPSTEDIEQCLTLVGWDKVQLDEGSVFLPIEDMELDFGGVVKEYAADSLAEIARSCGIQHGLINMGGDIRIIGPQPDGSPWLIGIVHPTVPDAAIATINVDSGALTTSGSYERFFEVEGKKYSHLINPKTGWPVDGLLSVSIAAPLAVVAGIIASIASLNNEQDGIAFLDECELSYLAIDQNLISHGRIPAQPSRP